MESIQLIVQLLVGFVALAGVLLVPLLIVYGIGQWILGPIDRLGSQLGGSIRYRIVDFFCLFFVIQFVLAVCLYGFSRPRTKLGLGVTLTVVVVLMWFQGIKRLSRAGIDDPWRRTLFNVYVLPHAYFGSVVAIPGVFSLLVQGLDEGFGSLSPAYWFFGLAVPLGLVVAKLCALWIVSPVGPPAANASASQNDRDTG